MSLRPDLAAIAAVVPQGARVLDIGCGDGALLAELRATAAIDGRGIELDAADVASAVGRGLSVVQGDADTDLVDYPADGFDVVILSNTLQAMRAPAAVLGEMLRIGRRAVVSFPNFGHWRVRLALLFGGRMPVTRTLPVSWHETPNIHLCTIDDFRATVAAHGFVIESAAFLSGGQQRGGAFANLLAEQAVFVLRRA
ncbi:methionine biosynthesis protein MetW [Polymorphobacter arshaanensis]|uniref:Methionine biosynthesis protein MetW n=1 Tax=Glacieibacterium arshaanense TaxID=2511025 RepID=A0A4Y9EQ33_9SPHN|nr:methionine biosynthesis protein MetW [Polymorphobacter arshaanensis]TFU03459.1 methionine biosynthesis protein MetW [Polymorphobacter arshaanensis]